MVLSPYGSGKYLSRAWAKERAEALKNPDGYAEAELEFLEVALGGTPEYTFEKDTAPIGKNRTARTYDIRDPRYNPAVGA